MPTSDAPVLIGGGRITACLTSAGRWDLLARTLDSLFAHHAFERFLIVEDSADPAFADRIRSAYPAVEVLLNDPRLGQHAAIDRVYGAVTTPFILHLEDDWVFTGPMDADDAAAVLDADPALSAVCFRYFPTLKWGHRRRSTRFSTTRAAYARMALAAHRDWHGYTFNPSLVRRAFWVEHGPFARFSNERALSRAMKDRGLTVAYQLPGVAQHIGSGRSVVDPARAGEARRLSGGWRRWFGLP